MTDAHLHHADEEIHNTFSHNILITLLSNLLYLVTRLFIPPIILRYVSLAEYGIWAYCFILINYLGMSVFGITNVYVRYAAIYYAKHQMVNINRLLTTGLLSVLAIFLFAVPLFWFLLPKILSLFYISPDLMSLAVWLIGGTTLIFMIELSFGAFGHLLQSLQRIALERMIWTISYLIETVLIIVFLIMGMGIYSLLWAFCIRTIIANILNAVACFRILPGLSIHLRYFDRKMLSHFFYFGGIVQLSGFVGITNRAIERLMAGMFIGAEATGLYEVGEKLPTTAQNLPGSINAVLLPTISNLHAKDRNDKIVQLYLHGSKLINIMSGLMMGFMTAFASPIITCWLGFDEKYQIAAVILAFFTWAYQMDILTGPATAVYRSLQQPEKEFFYGVIELALVLLAAAIGFTLFGFTYMVINVSVSTMMVLAALIYIALSNKFLKINQWHYFKDVLLPGLIPYIFGFLVRLISNPWYHLVYEHRWKIFVYLIFNGLVYLVMTSVFIYFFMSDAEERKAFNKQVLHTVRGLTGLKP